MRLPFRATRKSQEAIDQFCGDCQRRTAPDRACEDGMFKQMERVSRGDCIKAVVGNAPGMVTREEGFTAHSEIASCEQPAKPL